MGPGRGFGPEDSMGEAMSDTYAATYTETATRDESVFLSKVFAWMAIGLSISGLVAFVVAQAKFFPSSSTVLILSLVQLGMVFGIAFGINRISSTVATALFLAYSVITGLWLSYIFVAYSLGTIAAAFLASGGTFIVMAVIGFTTKRDLSKFGSFLFMALIGLVISSVVGIFWNFPGRTFIIMYVGLFIFVGLTAYEVWWLKRAGRDIAAAGPEMEKKVAILGALNLYINFINIFIRLLAIFGGGRD